MRIDNWNNKQFMATVDGSLIHSVTLSSAGIAAGTPNICGDAGFDDSSVLFTKEFTHTANSITVKLHSSLTQSATVESWGFSNFELLLYPCHNLCLTCSGPLQNDCLTCVNTCNASPCCEDYFYLKTPVLPCECPVCARCHISCKTCSGPSENECLSCESAETYSNVANTCTYPARKFILLLM